MAKPGQGNTELHEFLVTLVTQLFEAEAQAKKADKKEAQATAALLATVQAQRTRSERGLSWLRVCSGVQAEVCGSC
jgi:hypothetical protein